MKRKIKLHNVLLSLAFFFLMILFAGCPPNAPSIDPKASIDKVSDITETSFVVQWTLININPVKIDIELASDKDFNNILSAVAVNNLSAVQQKVDKLSGSTKYFVRLNVAGEANTNYQSNLKEVRTGCVTENITVKTSDGVNIVGRIEYLSTVTEKSPGIVFMGVFGLSNLWGGEDVYKDLIKQGYVCYLFDFRDQGASDSYDFNCNPDPDSLLKCLTRQAQYRTIDLEDCLKRFKEHPRVDSTRIALIGGSGGANVALNGACIPGVRAIVTLSASTVGMNSCKHKNVLYLVCEDNCNSFGCYVDAVKILYENSEEPKKMVIYPGSSHALDMLPLDGVYEEVMNWITSLL